MGYDEELVISQGTAGLCVEILYRSRGDSVSTWRVIEPYSTASVEIAGVWHDYLYGWDIDPEKNDHIRSYDIEKIEETKASSVPSENRFDFEI